MIIYSHQQEAPGYKLCKIVYIEILCFLIRDS